MKFVYFKDTGGSDHLVDRDAVVSLSHNDGVTTIALLNSTFVIVDERLEGVASKLRLDLAPEFRRWP